MHNKSRRQINKGTHNELVSEGSRHRYKVKEESISLHYCTLSFYFFLIV